MRKKLTSKLALKQLKENVYELDERQYERLNIIEKDLEILEILKKNIFISAEYERLKEELEND